MLTRPRPVHDLGHQARQRACPGHRQHRQVWPLGGSPHAGHPLSFHGTAHRPPPESGPTGVSILGTCSPCARSPPPRAGVSSPQASQVDRLLPQAPAAFLRYTSCLLSHVLSSDPPPVVAVRGRSLPGAPAPATGQPLRMGHTHLVTAYHGAYMVVTQADPRPCSRLQPLNRLAHRVPGLRTPPPAPGLPPLPSLENLGRQGPASILLPPQPTAGRGS